MAEGLVLVRSFCGARARVTAPSSTACLWPAAVEGFGFASCEDSALCLDVLRCLGGNAAETGDMRLTLGLPARTGDLGREWWTAPLAEGGPASGSANVDSVLNPSEMAVTSRKLQRCESVAGFRSVFSANSGWEAGHVVVDDNFNGGVFAACSRAKPG